MKVYLPNQSNGVLYVQPGATPEGAGVSEWMEGDRPRMFKVKFSGGVASVPRNLGRYLIDQDIVRASPILLPADFARAGVS